MLITNENYLQALKSLKQSYSELPWYQRWWFSIWSYRLSSALSAINLDHPTSEQVKELFERSKEAWFFNSIFGILTQFQEIMEKLNFSGRPKELKEEVGSWLPQKDVIALSLTSEENYAFFESMRHTNQLLMHVVHGEYDAVVALFKKNSHLLLHKGRVTDYSGRTFFYISGFQYALWALDKHMWTRMLDWLPLNETGAKIKAELYKQYQELKEKGVSYELNGERHRENHFDFENTIIKELTTQIKQVNSKYWRISFMEINRQWREGVGSAQKLLPMHVVYEYCSKERFDPVPAFIDQPSLNKQIIKYTNEDWFDPDSMLGTNFAVFKADGSCAQAACGLAGRGAIEAVVDLAAMQALCEIRTNDFRDLQSLLLEPVFDNQCAASQAYSV
ncbi:MAG: F-box protein [Tatlockia sp.]|nr:F-box protein [Tatlockia sp.]